MCLVTAQAREAAVLTTAQRVRRACAQPHWNFAQLHKETDQPAAWLKEVLLAVAVFNKRGPNQALWEIKPEYRTGAG